MKLFLLFILITLVPLVISTGITIGLLTRQMEEQVILSLDRESDQLKNAFNSEFSRLLTIGHLVSSNVHLRQCMTLYRAGAIGYQETSARVNEILREYTPMQYGVRSLRSIITVIGADGAVFGPEQYLKTMRTPAFQDTVQSFLEDYNQYDMRWVSDAAFSVDNPPPHDAVNYALHQIRSASNWGTIGVVAFQFRQSSLLSMYMSSVGNDQSVFVLTPSGNVVSMINNLGLGHETLDTLFHSGAFANGTSFADVEGRRLLFSTYEIPVSKWRLCTFSDTTGQLLHMRQIITLYLIMVAGCVLISLLLSYRFSVYFTKPVKTLGNAMIQMMRGDLTVRADKFADDEIGTLTDQFNQMVNRIADLMDQVILEQEAKRHFEMSALQSQISPHFMYNTLASLRYMIMMGDKENAEECILALGRILKYALSDTRQLITINMEAEHLNSYLAIAKFGFAAPLDAVVEIDPSIGDCLTMRLLLQPIVENAILHGLKTLKDSPTLRVRGYPCGEIIEFCVEDNGVGFDVSALSDSETSIGQSKHIGIKNVDTRIKLQFGSEYGLMIRSEIGGGTAVVMRIPKIAEREKIVWYENSDC